MSLQIQNGEYVRSHVAAQSERCFAVHPTWGCLAAIGQVAEPLRRMRLAGAGSLGSQVLVSVSSLCVVQRAAEELGIPNGKLAVCFTTPDIFRKITRLLA